MALRCWGSTSLNDNADDLVVLHTSEPPDRFTRFVQNNMGYLFKVILSFKLGIRKVFQLNRWRIKPPTQPAQYPQWDTLRARRYPTSSHTLAALLLVGAIAILYNVRSDSLKLGLIGLFTTMFAASVGC